MAGRVAEFLKRREQGEITPLNIPRAGFFGRLVAGFGDTPEQKRNILKYLGIAGSPADPQGEFRRPSSWELSDIADLVNEIPTVVGAGVYGWPGAIAGEGVRFGIGRLLGSEARDVNINRLIAETAGAAIGGKVFGGLFNKAANPYRAASITRAIEENVRRPAQRFRVNVPADALTESDFVGRAAARARSAPTPHGDALRSARSAMRQQQQDAVERIAQDAGSTSRGNFVGPDVFQEAREGASSARMDVIGDLFDRAREALPDPKTIPIVKDKTRAALGRITQRTQVADLPTQNITSGSRKMIESFRQDVESLQNFAQLDAFRRRVGDLLKSPKQMEELEKAGVDREFRDLYGALRDDLFDSMNEGMFARVFGQSKGEITGAATRNASAMERGVLSQRELAAKGSVGRPGTRPAQEPPLGQQRTSGELMDEIAPQIDAAQEARQIANEAMQDLLSTDRSTILRMMRDPGQAENIYSRLFRHGGSPDNIKTFKRIIGAEPTSGGLPATPEGQQAWEQVRSQLFTDIREAGQDAFAERLPNETIPLKGQELIRRMDQLGGERMLNEALGPEATKDLYDFGLFLINSTPTERPFSTISKEAGKRTPLTFFTISIVRRLWENLVDSVLRKTSFPLASSRASRMLTTGLAPKPGQQRMLRAVGASLGSTLAPTGGMPGATNR